MKTVHLSLAMLAATVLTPVAHAQAAAQPDTDEQMVVPANLRNPFPRMSSKTTNKGADITFSHVLHIDPRMVHWQKLAAEWLGAQKSSVAARR